MYKPDQVTIKVKEYGCTYIATCKEVKMRASCTACGLDAARACACKIYGLGHFEMVEVDCETYKVYAVKPEAPHGATTNGGPEAKAVPTCSYCGAAPAVKGYADMGTACCDDCSLIPQITNVPESIAAIRSETVPERLIRALRHEEAHEKRLGITVPICTRLRVLKSSGLALKRIMEATAT